MRMAFSDNFGEGEVFCRWLESRFTANKNVLGANTGGTGSGKSYRDLRAAELWYKYKFDEEFPIENICFSISEVMSRLNHFLTKQRKRKGEVLIFEEAGVNMGSLDFQNKISKMFSYVLQSFRSLNVGIFFNLPYLSMLNKSARMLMHYSFESIGIDKDNNLNKCKPLFIQVNQSTGKIYRKYLRIKINNKPTKVQRFGFYLPSDRLRQAYESKKLNFLTDFNEEFKYKLGQMEKDKLNRAGRPLLTRIQREVLGEVTKGKTVKEIANNREVSVRTIYKVLENITKKGYEYKIRKNSLGKAQK